MTKQEAIQEVLRIAAAEVGYLEKASNSDLDSKTGNAGYNNWNKYARDLDKTDLYNGKKNGYYWCDVFVDWCYWKAFGLANMLTMTGQPRKGCGAGCTYSAQYYKNIGRLYYSNPEPGDQIFFGNRNNGDYYHTGIVTEVKNGYVYTIEGNTSSDSGVVANGGAVARKCYRLTYSDIGCYGRPNWDIVKDMKTEAQIKAEEEARIKAAKEAEKMAMTQAEFEKMWLQMRKAFQDNDAGKWSDEAREWAVKTGLIAGVGNGSDGKPNYAWEDLLTREQFVTVLYRFAKLMETDNG